MERYKKKDMLQTVDTLLNANDAIARAARTNVRGTEEALGQCQESAIVLGTYIDTLDEKYANLVHILEDYCENIYQMSENLSDENVCRKISKKIQKQLTNLHNGIKYDLPDDKKEIVFLPYKASMWDSLESLWKEADADPACKAYVIPIPYFDKNPDGSFREEHYEGDQYPKNVPITRYDKYDLEAHHPDIIYIHNPYDECNHVTSVHPHFYARNLRNYTDKLVYIPYFILREIEPDDQTAIDTMKHFCFTPGTIYAHQVIVQSEKMRQIYINEYIKAAKEMGLPGEHVDRKFLEKKFLGTGSPKIDKVLNTKREDLEIPAEWLRIIEKPDGSWKKIVFYNTSVSALLQHSEKMLRKMESVFGIFKENRDEVALLWRPHPLIQATIESMRPKLWEGYQEIRDRYVAEGWGIYDDSADMDRAVVLSDAYYGDWSSVMQLCRECGMDILVQDVEKEAKLRDMNKIPIWFEDCVQVENDLWFSANDFNGLCKVNIETGKTEYVAQFPDEYQNADRLYIKVFRSSNKLIFIPHSAQNIAIYELDRAKFVTISLKVLEDIDLEFEDKYQFAETYGDFIYFFDIHAGVVKLNVTTGQLLKVKADIKEEMKGTILFDKHARIGNKVYGVFMGSNKVYIFDLETERYEISFLRKERQELLFCFADDKTLFLGGKGSLFQCDEKLDECREIYTEKKAEWIDGCYAKGKFYLCDKNGKGVSVFSENGKRIEILSGVKTNEHEYPRWRNSLLLERKNNELIFIDLNTYSVLIISSNEVKILPIHISRDDLIAHLDLHKDLLRVRKYREAVMEGAPGYLFALDNWLEAIIEKNVLCEESTYVC